MGASCPIFSSENEKEFWGAVQILKPIERFVKGSGLKQARIFRMPDELLLEIYAKFICLLFSCHQKDFVLKQENHRTETYITSVQKFISAKDHQDFLLYMQQQFSKYFGFENIGLLFLEGDVLFTYNTHKLSNGEYLTDVPIQFPSRSGISGQCYAEDYETYATNNPQALSGFQEDLDNSAKVPRLRNLVIGIFGEIFVNVNFNVRFIERS